MEDHGMESRGIKVIGQVTMSRGREDTIMLAARNLPGVISRGTYGVLRQRILGRYGPEVPPNMCLRYLEPHTPQITHDHHHSYNTIYSGSFKI